MWYIIDKLLGRDKPCTINAHLKERKEPSVDFSMEKNTVNNGGTTDYYAVPEKARTLNDLIEHKKMEFWRGEVFKASYAIDGRIAKNSEPNPMLSELREVNKIIYYGNRRKAVLLKRLKAAL